MITEQSVEKQPLWVGVDVGKETLAVYRANDGKALTVSNQTEAIENFLRQNPAATIVLESTGGYEARLIAKATEMGLVVYRANARRVRAFMESVGIYAKTDAIDAKALADYAAANNARLHPFSLPDPDMKALQQWSRRRDELIKQRTQERNRLQAPDNENVLVSFRAVLACLDKQIALAEERIDELVSRSSALQAKIAVLTAVKGVGSVTSVALLVSMPELGHLNGKQAASMAGLAPFPRDSGKKKGRRRTRGGRVEARNALYMAALSACRFNPVIKPFYQRLLKNGKRPLQALIAAARKLLVILNAKLRDASSLIIA